MADPKDGDQVQARRTQSAKPAAAEPRGSGGEDAGASIVVPRRRQYLVGTRPLPGVAPIATDLILQALNVMDDVEVLRRIRPRGLQMLSPNAPGLQDIIVARIDEQRAEALRQNAPPNLIVEHDAPLDYGDALWPGAVFPRSVGVIPLLGRAKTLTLRVLGEGGQPLAGASVFVYGSGLPAQGVTDGSGQATVSIYDAETAANITAIHVKPAADHWDRFIAHPALASGVNVVPLRPLSESFPDFPGERLVGWGRRLLAIDQLGDGIAAIGTGIKVGLIDSGCDTAHPLLRHVSEGVDLTAPNQPGGWTIDSAARGTHAAGIIAGQGRPRQGTEGFVPGAALHVLKLFPGGRFSDLIDALDLAIERRLDLVSLNLGSAEISELVVLKLAEARQRGVAVIAAAGNTGGPVQFPAQVPGVLAVTAIGKHGEFPPDSSHAQAAAQQPVGAGGVFLPRFAARGPQIAMVAPGVAVVSTVPGGGYAAWDGSSAAASHVAGLSAILLSSHPLFASAYGLRGEQRVSALFDLLRAAAMPHMLTDPLGIAPGVPVLHRVPGWQPPLDRPATAAPVEGQARGSGSATAATGTRGFAATSSLSESAAGGYFSMPGFVQQLRAMGMI